MLILSLTQALLGIAATVASGAASFLIIRHEDGAPMWMVVAGSIGLVFFLTFNPLRFEMLGPILLIAAGVALMLPSADVDVLDDFEIGESTATRRRR